MATKKKKLTQAQVSKTSPRRSEPNGPQDFSSPWEIPDLSLAFPANTTRAMPPYSQVSCHKSEHAALFQQWFYGGLETFKAQPKAGIDGTKAMRHIRFVMGGFDSKHEHKESAVCWLLDKWFDKIEWTAKAGRA